MCGTDSGEVRQSVLERLFDVAGKSSWASRQARVAFFVRAAHVTMLSHSSSSCMKAGFGRVIGRFQRTKANASSRVQRFLRIS